MYKKILISRIDSIGDVILTLPVAGVIKTWFPGTVTAFLGQEYTKPIITRSRYVDEFHDWYGFTDQVEGLRRINADAILHVFPRRQVARAAKEAGIRKRIGTSHRLYHWLTCNRLINLGRKKSGLNEGQLNLQLLRALGIRKSFSLQEIPKYYGWDEPSEPIAKVGQLIDHERFNLIMHMKSQGNALEWPPEKFLSLARLLPEDKYRIFISGTAGEGEKIRNEVPELLEMPHTVFIAGMLNLDEFIQLVQWSDGLVSSSTGPLHIAAIAGIHALGLYPDTPPKDAVRWGAIGEQAEYISDIGSDLDGTYLTDIDPGDVRERISEWHKIRKI